MPAKAEALRVRLGRELLGHLVRVRVRVRVRVTVTVRVRVRVRVLGLELAGGHSEEQGRRGARTAFDECPDHLAALSLAAMRVRASLAALNPAAM